MKWLKRVMGYPDLPDVPTPTAKAAVAGQPIVVNAGQTLEHARYRIDAITRYLDQTAERGETIEAGKLAHLLSERTMYQAMVAHEEAKA